MHDLQQRFNQTLTQILEENKLVCQRAVVAVSGGADSLALALLLNYYMQKNEGKLCALTVNHHLRDEATAEAEYVAEVMHQNGIEHHVLDWQHEPLQSGIETKARQARYELMTNWCIEHNYPLMFIAHHLCDQAETFLMRLQRGSGVDGLAAMSEITERNGIKLLRPLLSFEPQLLKDYLKSLNVAWKEDASNQCDDYLRVRIRKMLPELERNLGLNISKIGAAASALAETKKYFADEVAKFIKNHCHHWYGTGWSFSQSTFLSLHKEFRFRILSELLKITGKNMYTPEYAALKRLDDKLSGEDFTGCTLGGCEVIKFQRKIWIIPEQKAETVLACTQWRDFAKVYCPHLKCDLPYRLRVILFEKYGKAVEFEK